MLTISREDAEEMLADLMDPETDWDPPEHFEKAKKFALDAFVHYVDHINRLHCSPENDVRWALEEIVQSADLDDDADRIEPGSRPRDCYVISSDLIEQARKAVTSGQ